MILRKHSKSLPLSIIQIRTKTTQKVQRRRSRPLQTLTMCFLTRIRDEFMTKQEQKVFVRMNKVKDKEEQMWTWTIYSSNSLAVEEEVVAVSRAVASTSTWEEASSSRDKKSFQIYLRILMLKHLTSVQYSNSIDERRSGSYISSTQNFKSAKTSKSNTCQFLRSCMVWSRLELSTV